MPIITLMARITVSIPQELCDKMKRHPEIKWSEVVRKSLEDYIERLEIVEGGVVPTKKLAERLRKAGLDVSNVDLEKAVKYCEEGHKLERKRLPTAQP